jgi:predicted TIM-barrel fold metal-dependent hydrolase
MSQIPVIDADGHVTETNEQVAKYLDEPYRRRPLALPLYPADGWDRRLLGTLGSVGGTAEQWLAALDDGGMEMTVLYPTLGLFLSFLKDRAWAVAICRAYNTFLHEEFIKKSPRLQAVALLPIQDPDAAAAELERGVRQLGLVGAMLAADGNHVLGDTRFTPIYETAQRLNVMLGIHASGSHLGGPTGWSGWTTSTPSARRRRPPSRRSRASTSDPARSTSPARPTNGCWARP